MAYRYLSEAEIKWLRNRRNDSRPEVRVLARQVFEEKFPHQTRNEIKALLDIENIVFHVCGKLYDSYGDEYIVNAEYTADTTGKAVKKLYDNNSNIVSEQSVDIGVKAARKVFSVAVHNYDIPFWGVDLYHEVSYDPDIDLLSDLFDDDELEDNDETEQPDALSDDRVPSWSVEIKYKNGTEQSTKGYDFIPDPVMELFDDFDSYFKEDYIDDELDEDENDE